jgi:WD40 repeat protein
MSIVALLAVASAVAAFVARNQAVASNARSMQMESAEHQSLVAQAIAEQKAVVAQGKAVSASHQAQREAQVALQQRQVAIQQRGVAQVQQRQALSERSQVFMQVGRQSLLDGDYDNAAILLAAAYNGDSNNAVLQVLLRQALDNFSIRAGAITAHSDLITALAFDPNQSDREIATASADGSAKLWTDSGRLVHEFRDQGDLITALAFDPSGRYLVTVGRDGSARMHDLAGITPSSNPPVIRLVDVQDDIEGHAGRINSVAFDRRGDRVLTAGSDGLVKLWGVPSGRLVAQWVGAPQAGITVNEAAFGGDDGIVAACAADGSLTVWKASSGAQIGSVTDASKSPLLHVAISPNGQNVVAGALDGTVLVYNVGSKQSIERHDQHGAINAVSFDAAGGHVLTASEDGTAFLYSTSTGEPIKSLPAKPGAPAALTAAFDPAGIGIETTYDDGTVNLWTREGDPVAVLRGHKGAALVAGFSPDGALLATGGADGKVYFWHPPSALARASFAHHGEVDSIEFDPQGGRMLTASFDGTAALWQVGGVPQLVRVLPHSPGAAWVVAAHFSADGSRVITAGGDRVKVWNATASGDDPLASMGVTAPNKRFTQAAFVGDSYDVIAAQTDDGINNPVYKTNGWRVWSSDGSKKLAVQPGWQSGIRRLALSDDGSSVLAISDSGYASFSSTDGKHGYSDWNSVAEGAALGGEFVVGGVTGTIHVVTGKGANVSQWAGDDDRVSAFAYSRATGELATGGTGGTLGSIWDLARAGATHVLLQGGEGEIESAAFSPDATFLMAICSDGSVKVWDRTSGDLVASEVPASRATAAAFTPDGSAIVIGAADGGVYYWPLRGGIPSPRDAAALVLRESDRSGLTDPLVSQAFVALQKAPGGGG